MYLFFTADEIGTGIKGIPGFPKRMLRAFSADYHSPVWGFQVSHNVPILFGKSGCFKTGVKCKITKEKDQNRGQDQKKVSSSRNKEDEANDDHKGRSQGDGFERFYPIDKDKAEQYAPTDIPYAVCEIEFPGREFMMKAVK
jgi:hypothetical protein